MSDLSKNEELLKSTSSLEVSKSKSDNELIPIANSTNNNIIFNQSQNSFKEINLTNSNNSNILNNIKSNNLINIEENLNKSEKENNTSGDKFTNIIETSENKINNSEQNLKINREKTEDNIYTLSSDKSDNIINKEENIKEDSNKENNNLINNENNNKRKTFFNYEENFENQEKIVLVNKIDEDINKSMKQNIQNNNNGNIIVNYNKNYSFGNREINESESGHFNTDTITQKEEKEEEKKKEAEVQASGNVSDKILSNKNQLINSKDYFFNYRNDTLFNKINVLGTKLEEKKYETDSYFTSSLNNNFKTNIKNEINYKSKYLKEKHINFEKTNINIGTDISNFYDSLNSTNTIDSMQFNKVVEEGKDIKSKILSEEVKLKNLENEKNKLIKEEKERRKKILDEINKKEAKKLEMRKKFEETRKEKIKDKEILNNILKKQQTKKKEIEELINKSKRDEEQLKIISDFNINTISNDDIKNIEQIQKGNELANKHNLKIGNTKFEDNKENDINFNNNLYSHNIKFHNEIDNGSQNTNFDDILYVKDKDNNNSFIKTIKEFHKNHKDNTKIIKSCSNKFNLNSYFKLNDNDNSFNSRINKNTMIKSFKNKNFTKNKSVNNISKNPPKLNNNPISLTPNGLYRSNNTENNESSNYSYIRTESVDMLNKKYHSNIKLSKNNEIIKTLSSNTSNSNYMTQTRFYRVRLNPEELSSNYAKEKVMALNNLRNNSYDINSYRNNYIKNEYNGKNKIIHSISNLENLFGINKTFSNKNIELDNKVYNDILYNNQLNNYNKRLNTYRKTSSLKKGNSYCNLKQVFNNSNNFRANGNSLLNNYIKNNDRNKMKNNSSLHRSFRFSFPINNISLNDNNNGGYICKNCLKTRIMKICPNCEKIFNESNYVN